MNRKTLIALGVSALLVAVLLAGIDSGDLPTGVSGEWQWPKINASPSLLWLLVAAVGVAAYGGYAALGFRALGVPSRRGWREIGWVAGLTASAAAVQVFLAVGAPDEYDLTRWAYVHYFRGSTGYYEIAREQAAADPWKFLADYPTWIQSQDPFHIGTHPPGIIATHAALLSLTERSRGLTDFLNAAMPPSIVSGFRQLEVMNHRTLPRADRAEIYLVSLLTFVLCAGTVAPLYLMAREALPPQLAWCAAALWPLAPALNLFQPLADAAYPFLSAAALASGAWAARLNGTPGSAGWIAIALGLLSGATMGFGMMYTLAFLPVGLMVALVVLTTRSNLWLRRFKTLAWIGAGFLTFVGLVWLATAADPFEIWRWNLRHHARFYEVYHRSYWPWLFVNPIETAVAMGLPAAVWCVTGAAADHRYVPRTAWCALAVVALANLTGRNMGEVARLWMLFLPPLFTAAGVGLTRLGGGTRTVFATVALMGIQTLGLQTLVQLVYPV